MNQATEKGNGQRIALSDEKRLERYFGPLEGVFRRSTFGAMIERLERDSQGSETCPRCGGIGFSDEDVLAAKRSAKRLDERRRAALADQRPDKPFDAVGVWEEYRKQAEDEWRDQRCSVCDGTGAKPVPRREQAPVLNAKKWLSREGGRWVTVRKRNGKPRQKWMPGPWVPMWLDAKASGAAYEYPRDPFALHEALVEYAKMSRQIDCVAAIDQRVVTGLEVYYGDEGAVWGRTRHGRMFALYRVTKAARQLLSRSGGENPTELGVSPRIAVEADLDRQQPKTWRRQLLNAMDDQARRIYDRMCVVWTRVAAPEDPAPDWREGARRMREHAESRRGVAA